MHYCLYTILFSSVFWSQYSYRERIEKHSVDLQWSAVHGAVPTHHVVLRAMPRKPCNTFGSLCPRLVPLFCLLQPWLGGLGDVLEHGYFICSNICLADFLNGQAMVHKKKSNGRRCLWGEGGCREGCMVFVLTFYLKRRGQETRGDMTLTNLPSAHCVDYIKISQEKLHAFVL